MQYSMCHKKGYMIFVSVTTVVTTAIYGTSVVTTVHEKVHIQKVIISSTKCVYGLIVLMFVTIMTFRNVVKYTCICLSLA